MTEWGYPQQNGTLYQDNISTIISSHQGHKPYSKLSHVNRRFFSAAEYLKNGTITMPHCETGDMLPDPLTKAMDIPTTLSHIAKLSGNARNMTRIKQRNEDEEHIFGVMMSMSIDELQND